MVASPGDGQGMDVPSFLYRRLGSCVNELCKVLSASHVFRLAGDFLRRRVAEKTRGTKIGHV